MDVIKNPTNIYRIATFPKRIINSKMINLTEGKKKKIIKKGSN
jgi:hypothetical protein